MKDGLTTFQREAIREVLAEFPQVERAVLFGSRAMGTWSPASDVDLALFGDSLTLEDEARIAARMEDLGFLFTVDLVRHATIQSEALKGHISNFGRAFYVRSDDDTSCTSGLTYGSTRQWPSVPFVSLLDGGTRNGIYKPKEFHGRGAKIINMGELFAYPRLRSVEMRRVDVNSSELARFSVSSGDLLFARRSLVAAGAGKCSMVVEANEPTVFESSIIRARPRPEIADSAFLFYLFRSPLGVHKLDTILRHVAVAGITGKDLEALELPYPPIREQRAIADILGTLDDKIELNRKMNGTLEAMARAIFQSWFVNFDPVHAKTRGEQPAGMSADIAALFPSEFEDSELGPIPKGWRVQRVVDIADRIAMGPFGSNIKTDNFVAEGVPVVRGNNLRNGFVDSDFVFLTDAKADELSNAVAFPGDLVFTHRGTLGQVGLIPAKSRFRRYVVSQSQMLLRVDRRLVAPEYTYLFFRSHAGQSRLLANANATGVPAIARPTTSLKEIRLTIPPPEVMSEFRSVAQATFARMHACNEQIRTLAALRDTLLPRLISGQLRVPELTVRNKSN